MSGFTIEVKEGDWGGTATQEIGVVLGSAADCFAAALGERATEPVCVYPNASPSEPPITLLRRSSSGSVTIRLGARGCLWARFVFQFSHELCHVMANIRQPLRHPSKPRFRAPRGKG